MMLEFIVIMLVLLATVETFGVAYFVYDNRKQIEKNRQEISANREKIKTNEANIMSNHSAIESHEKGLNICKDTMVKNRERILNLEKHNEHND